MRNEEVGQALVPRLRWNGQALASAGPLDRSAQRHA